MRKHAALFQTVRAEDALIFKRICFILFCSMFFLIVYFIQKLCLCAELISLLSMSAQRKAKRMIFVSNWVLFCMKFHIPFLPLVEDFFFNSIINSGIKMCNTVSYFGQSYWIEPSLIAVAEHTVALILFSYLNFSLCAIIPSRKKSNY